MCEVWLQRVEPLELVNQRVEPVIQVTTITWRTRRRGHACVRGLGYVRVASTVQRRGGEMRVALFRIIGSAGGEMRVSASCPRRVRKSASCPSRNGRVDADTDVHVLHIEQRCSCGAAEAGFIRGRSRAAAPHRMKPQGLDRISSTSHEDMPSAAQGLMSARLHGVWLHSRIASWLVWLHLYGFIVWLHLYVFICMSSFVWLHCMASFAHSRA
jgi:hypothetical protein